MEAEQLSRDLADLAHRFTIRKWLAVGIGVLGAIGLIALLVTLSAYTTANNAQRQTSARADCKTEYSSVLGGPVKNRDNLTAVVSSLGAQLNSQLGTALLNSEVGIRPSQADVSNYAATKALLDSNSRQLLAAIATVNKLPTLNQASTHGFTFDGTKYPPCPVVTGSRSP